MAHGLPQKPARHPYAVRQAKSHRILPRRAAQTFRVQQAHAQIGPSGPKCLLTPRARPASLLPGRSGNLMICAWVGGDVVMKVASSCERREVQPAKFT